VAVAQGLDRRVQRAAVALAASDRHLAHAVEDRAEAADVPELGLGQGADLAVLARGDPDHHRVHLAVVVSGQKHRAGAGQVVEALDAHPPPPGSYRHADGHRDAVGAGEALGLGGSAHERRRSQPSGWVVKP
jgi:hypothetical protein